MQRGKVHVNILIHFNNQTRGVQFPPFTKMNYDIHYSINVRGYNIFDYKGAYPRVRKTSQFKKNTYKIVVKIAKLRSQKN